MMRAIQFPGAILVGAAVLLCVVPPSLGATPQCIGFSWTANLNKRTGIASAEETTVMRHVETKAMRGMFQSMVRAYPLWLCRPHMTFGLFRASQQEDGSTHLQLRLGGVTMLTFGAARDVSKVGSSDVNMIIPVKGGLLSLKTDDNQDRGRLEFMLSMQSDTSKTREDEDRFMTISTRIAGNYRPTLAGAAPVPSPRAALYRCTQSIVHAYVMWRFHRSFRQQMRKQTEYS